MNEPGIPKADSAQSAKFESSGTRSPSSGGGWGKVFGGVVVVALIAGAGAYYFLGKAGGKSAKADEHSEATSGSSTTALPVEVVHPHPGGVERSTTQAGSVHAYEHAALYAKVSGFLKDQTVDIGDRVKLGQLLAVIDDPEVDKAVEQNQASLDQTRAKVKVAEAKIRSAEASRKASEAMVQAAQTLVPAKVSNEELQKKTLKRIASLVVAKATDEKMEDEQKDRLDVAVSEVGVARAGVISAQAEVMNKAALVDEARADLIEAQANVEVAEANLGKAKVLQSYTRITSPYDGVITDRNFHRGDFIRSASEGGNQPVLAVSRTDLMRVVMPIPDTDVPFVDRGDQATFEIVALPGRKFTGIVARFSEAEDSESRNMRTEVDLPNPDGKLREGMYGRVTVLLRAASPQGVTIPSSGLLGLSGTGEGNVYVVKDGKAHKVKVRVGNDNGLETEILSGLTTEDQVITSYNGSLTEGTLVKGELKRTSETSH